MLYRCKAQRLFNRKKQNKTKQNKTKKTTTLFGGRDGDINHRSSSSIDHHTPVKKGLGLWTALLDPSRGHACFGFSIDGWNRIGFFSVCQLEGWETNILFNWMVKNSILSFSLPCHSRAIPHCHSRPLPHRHSRRLEMWSEVSIAVSWRLVHGAFMNVKMWKSLLFAHLQQYRDKGFGATNCQ